MKDTNMNKRTGKEQKRKKRETTLQLRVEVYNDITVIMWNHWLVHTSGVKDSVLMKQELAVIAAGAEDRLKKVKETGSNS